MIQPALVEWHDSTLQGFEWSGGALVLRFTRLSVYFEVATEKYDVRDAVVRIVAQSKSSLRCSDIPEDGWVYDATLPPIDVMVDKQRVSGDLVVQFYGGGTLVLASEDLLIECCIGDVKETWLGPLQSS